ncbi:hypothetical protein GCWB2_01055 [Gordonia rubripertincta]|nr:hypothetical protein GCWB2_01055 [Gordonia rubripertincta]
MRPSFRTARPMELTRLDADSATTYFVHTDVVNWVLLEQDGELTLIDGGYPGQAGRSSSRSTGSAVVRRTFGARC